jgi:hypothetical protein
MDANITAYQYTVVKTYVEQRKIRASLKKTLLCCFHGLVGNIQLNYFFSVRCEEKIFA